MATGDISNLPQGYPAGAAQLPKIGLVTMFRLGLFQMGLGLMSLLTLGLLNRIMIAELKIPALLVTGAIAMNQFIAPARVWFGQMSDAKPILGTHRTGYVWVGAALFAVISFLTVQVMWQTGAQVGSGQFSAWIALLALMFALYGLAISASSTPFTALLVDISDEDNRSKLVGIVWSMLMVGIIIGAIILSISLKQLELDAPLATIQASINRVFIVVPGVVFLLTLAATWGVEKRYSRYSIRSGIADREDKISLDKALRVLTANRQTGLFFTFLLVMTLSLFLQDGVLEPYGGEVFGMTISDTTKLNAFWGTGTLLGLSATGFLVVPRLGKKGTTRLGCLLVAASFILLILAGFTSNPAMLKGTLLLFGIASGITTTGALSLMLDLTAAETAGTFVGAWGLAQAMSRGLATAAGGGVLSFGKTLFGAPLPAYGLVFLLPIVGMLVAVGLLQRVNVEEFQSQAKTAIAQILATDID